MVIQGDTVTGKVGSESSRTETETLCKMAARQLKKPFAIKPNK
jgi:hypothetical protein